MHPAPSVILFTVLSGLGFGFMAILALVGGGFGLWVVGYALACSGLVASAFHLGNPQRALLAFTQWRSSWLSREACVSTVTLAMLAPVVVWDMPLPWRVVAAGMCLLTVFCSSMIYAQLKSVPRWNHWIVPVTFLAFAVAGGALMAGWALCLLLAPLMLWGWHIGDRRFAQVGATLGTATGLGPQPRVWEQMTGGSYLLTEMIHVVGRKHARRLRGIAVAMAALLPGVLVLISNAWPVIVLAVLCHVIGAFAQRWLFFAEAEHVVGLYYGRR